MMEFDEKQGRIRSLLRTHGLDALLLRRVSSFAWATCGAASYVNTAATEGASSLLIGPEGRYVITNNIEAARLEHEEQLRAQGWEFRIARWYEPIDAIAELTRGLRLGADGAFPGAVDLSDELSRLRAQLTPEEGERFRALGRLCAEAVASAIRAVSPGQTEYELAGALAHESQSRGVQPIVNLVATDERVMRFRHPLPTDKPLERYAMLVLCGRKCGLVCSITRLVHFGPLPQQLTDKAHAVARVDAALIAATRPGRRLSEIFDRARRVYAETGFGDEWQLHHQGGAAGYEPREYLGTPTASEVVSAGQAYAWNPSIAGSKSEDTILVGQDHNETMTAVDDWPAYRVHIDGQTILRPAILEV